MSDEPDALDDESAEPGESAQAKKSAKPPKPPKPPKPVKVKKAKTKGKGFNWVLVLIPIALLAAAVLACSLPPTRAILAKGPLKPIFSRFGLAPASGTAAKPDPVADAKRLADEVRTDRTNAAAKDAQIAQLQSQVKGLSAPPSAAPSPTPKATPAAITDDVKRAATYWAGMDADKAAAIVKQLPDPYVKLVFSQMPPDAVSDIMSELPAKTAARLTAADQSDAP
jgi:hypothetical protein